MIQSVFIQLFTRGARHREPERVLDLLEHSEIYRPTHWAEAQHLRDPYSRPVVNDAIEAIRQRPQPDVLYVKRVIQPRYRCELRVAPDSPEHEQGSWIDITSDLQLAPGEPELLSELATALANALDVDFGLVDLQFADAPGDRMKTSGHEHFGLFLEQGPSTLYARTFLGTGLMKRLGGSSALRECGLHPSTLSETVCQVDLLSEPWSHSPSALKAAQQKALQCLRPSGVFESD